MGTIFQDRKTGRRVRIIGSRGASEDEPVLVRSSDGEPPYYAQLAQLIPCDDTGKPDYDEPVRPAKQEADEPLPEPFMPIVENRLNINVTSAEDLAKRVPGLQYRTAKTIKKLQQSQPGEKFRTLDQVKQASTRVNWDALFRQNLLYVA